jgi:hypothetical protein
VPATTAGSVGRGEVATFLGLLPCALSVPSVFPSKHFRKPPEHTELRRPLAEPSRKKNGV